MPRKLSEDAGCSIDAGALGRILDKGQRLFFHGEPETEEFEEDSDDCVLHLTSLSLINDDGEFFVDLPEGGFRVRVPFSELEDYILE